MLSWDHRVVQVGRNLRGGLHSSPLLTAGSALRSDEVALGFVLSDLETSRDGDCTTSLDHMFCLMVLMVMFVISCPLETSRVSVCVVMSCCPAYISVKSLALFLWSLLNCHFCRLS